jgi:hypothetical protein
VEGDATVKKRTVWASENNWLRLPPLPAGAVGWDLYSGDAYVGFVPEGAPMIAETGADDG